VAALAVLERERASVGRVRAEEVRCPLARTVVTLARSLAAGRDRDATIKPPMTTAPATGHKRATSPGRIRSPESLGRTRATWPGRIACSVAAVPKLTMRFDSRHPLAGLPPWSPAPSPAGGDHPRAPGTTTSTWLASSCGRPRPTPVFRSASAGGADERHLEPAENRLAVPLQSAEAFGPVEREVGGIHALEDLAIAV
jgi:hypothetical protein